MSLSKITTKTKLWFLYNSQWKKLWKTSIVLISHALKFRKFRYGNRLKKEAKMSISKRKLPVHFPRHHYDVANRTVSKSCVYFLEVRIGQTNLIVHWLKESLSHWLMHLKKRNPLIQKSIQKQFFGDFSWRTLTHLWN